ncbi:hypothetical protein K438DRAFT_1990381 [Mycena galopus ATCC 62051]|nr:hypothetical protein K438DRAFT_1990381 [Mycena galopus ATCC 62051]
MRQGKGVSRRCSDAPVFESLPRTRSSSTKRAHPAPRVDDMYMCETSFRLSSSSALGAPSSASQCTTFHTLQLHRAAVPPLRRRVLAPRVALDDAILPHVLHLEDAEFPTTFALPPLLVPLVLHARTAPQVKSKETVSRKSVRPSPHPCHSKKATSEGEITLTFPVPPPSHSLSLSSLLALARLPHIKNTQYPRTCPTSRSRSTLHPTTHRNDGISLSGPNPNALPLARLPVRRRRDA